MDTSAAGTIPGSQPAPIPLDDAVRAPWMRRAEHDATLRIIGITGHLFLDVRQRERTREEVRRQVRATCAAGIARVRFLSGLAPGADLVATDAAMLEAKAAGLAVELIALLVGSSRVDLQACKLEYSIVSPK